MPGTSASGKRPMPTALKKLRGNPGHRPLNREEPTPPLGAPVMPKCLSKLAKKAWRDTIPELERMGTISTVDGKMLAIYCESWADYLLAKKDVEKYGAIIEEPIVDRLTGEVAGVRRKKNPAVAVKNEAAKLMKTYGIEFGLTAASRTRLHAEKPREPDPMDAVDERGVGRGRDR